MFVYIRSEPTLWSVGHYNPDGGFVPESDWPTALEAQQQVHYLNGGKPSDQAPVDQATPATPNGVDLVMAELTRTAAATPARGQPAKRLDPMHRATIVVRYRCPEERAGWYLEDMVAVLAERFDHVLESAGPGLELASSAGLQLEADGKQFVFELAVAVDVENRDGALVLSDRIYGYALEQPGVRGVAVLRLHSTPPGRWQEGREAGPQ